MSSRDSLSPKKSKNHRYFKYEYSSTPSLPLNISVSNVFPRKSREFNSINDADESLTGVQIPLIKAENIVNIEVNNTINHEDNGAVKYDRKDQ